MRLKWTDSARMNRFLKPIKTVAAPIGGGMQRAVRWFLTVQNYSWSAPLIFLGLVLLLANSSPFHRFELITVDARMRALADSEPEVSDDIVFVGIGDPSIRAIGNWSRWKRADHARVLDLLSGWNPKAIAYDVLFADLGDPEDDAQLADVAFEKLGGIITFAAHLKQEKEEDEVHEAATGLNVANHTEWGFSAPFDADKVRGKPSSKFDRIYTAELPVLPYETLAANVPAGFVECHADRDGLRRRIPLLVRVGEDFYPTLVTQTLLTYWGISGADVEVEFGKNMVFHTRDGDVEVPIDQHGELMINWRRLDSSFGANGRGYKTVEYAALRHVLERIPPGEPLPAELGTLTGKIFIFGQNSTGLTDIAATPLDPQTPLPTVHLNALNSILMGDFIRVAPFGWSVAAWFAAAFGSCWFLRNRNIAAAILVPVAAVLIFVWFCFWVYLEHRLLLPMFWPVLFFGLINVGAWGSRWLKELEQRMEIRNMFSSYVSGPLLEHLEQNPEKIALGGEVRPVSCFFSDIRSFTTISESMEPSKLVDQLNEYFTDMVACVHEHDGTLHKYIGDAVMAVWGDVIESTPEKTARESVAAALEMRERLETLNADWKKRGEVEFAIGMGINFGEVLVGHIGAPDRREFTVIGDAVNTASRIEGLTKQFQTDLLVGESVEQLLDESFIRRPVGLIVVKGKTKPLAIYEVLDRATPENAKIKAWAEKFSEAFDLYLEREFERAEKRFAECRAERPDDFCSKSYVESCRELQTTPPGGEWQGVIVMKSK